MYVFTACMYVYSRSFATACSRPGTTHAHFAAASIQRAVKNVLLSGQIGHGQRHDAGRPAVSGTECSAQSIRYSVQPMSGPQTTHDSLRLSAPSFGFEALVVAYSLRATSLHLKSVSRRRLAKSRVDWLALQLYVHTRPTGYLTDQWVSQRADVDVSCHTCHRLPPDCGH